MKIIELLMRNTIPNKKFFNSNEIASLLNIEPQEIRSWEAEFPQIRSLKTAKGQRIYRREDVILFASVKHLLKEKKLTIAGAQRVLAEADENYLMAEEHAEPVFAQEQPLTLVEPHATLLDVARMLPSEEDDYDDRSQRLYQQCGTISESDVPVVAKEHLGEMIHDALVHKTNQTALKQGVSRLEYDKLRASLMASKDSLQQVLRMLNKFDHASMIKDVPTIVENH